MQLTTPIHPTKPPFSFTLKGPFLLLGSCFSDNVGLRMQHAGLDVCNNPFGTLYNPASIAELLTRALNDVELTSEHLVYHDGLWHSWLHHTTFSHPNRGRCLQQCNDSIHRTHSVLYTPNLTLIITFGTAYVYSLNSQIVANCHKLPPDNFLRRRLSVDEICNLWNPVLQRLSDLQIHSIFTVSPIRHLADGAHDNQLSKSSLLLAIDRLMHSSENTDIYYFPSYEILLDELRDYRFYARDLCHPSDLAADLVWERFAQTFFTPAQQQQILLNEKQYRQTQHRPITQPLTH